MQLFLMALAVVAAEPPPRPMEVAVIRDAITDRVRAFATLRERRHRLVVSCDPARYEGPRVTFHSDRWLSTRQVFTGYGPITHRFDDGVPRRMMWNIDDRSGRLIGRSRVAAFLAELTEAERLVIRTRDIEHHRLDLVFRLEGVRPAVEQALAACGEQEAPPPE